MKAIGERAPDVLLHTRVRDESVPGANPYRWEDVSTGSLFAGRRVVVFALPGAFTPTCSSAHVPEYEARYGDIRAQGVDEIYCVSVNDAFVMHQWGKQLGVEKVTLLPDGNAEFTRQMGMLVRKENLGFGMRSWRYSVVIDDGAIEQIFAEPGFSDDCPTDPFGVSGAAAMLAYLKTHPKKT